jgi:hypothetical protein
LHAVNSESQGTHKTFNLLIWLLALLSLAFSLWAVRVGWHNSIYDFHGFRQAQTAISAQSIRDGGPILRYETPVLGPPWSMPFEFPLYQALVAGVSRLSAMPIDQAGRLVSVLFFYLCLFPLASIMSSLGLRRLQIVPTLALFAANPFYIFISRLVMIESTALFFSLAYLALMLALAQASKDDRVSRHLLLAALCGAIAGPVKATTFAPYLMLGAVLMVGKLLRQRRDKTWDSKLFLAIFGFCFVLPAAATLLWTKFADAIKLRNPITAQLTSSALRTWNFGTLSQRLQVRSYWWVNWNLGHLIGLHLLALILILLLIFYRRSLWMMALCFAVYIGTAEIFFNLYFVHHYYPYSVSVLIIGGLGYTFGSLLGAPDKRAWLGLALFAVVLAAGAREYHRDFYVTQNTNAPGKPSAAAWIDQATQPSDAIAIFGWGYSPELPYQSHRRAVMDWQPEWPSAPLANSAFQKALDNQGAAHIGAVAVCFGVDPALPQYLLELGMPATPQTRLDGCDLYKRN